MNKKKRLDLIVHELYPQYSRRQIQSWIMQGKVKVDDVVTTKSGTQVRSDVNITLEIQEPKYVGRAGFKLEKALDHFKVDVDGLVVLDAGLSTGGFTDCLLQRGATKIYGVDVGYGQVHEKIRNHAQVVVIERTNLRNEEDVLEKVDQKVDLVTLDLSFISILKVMETVLAVIKQDGQLIVLIKPQFEAEKKDVGKGGVIRDETVHQKVLDKVVEGIKSFGFTFIGVIESPIRGATGNKEFLAYFKY